MAKEDQQEINRYRTRLGELKREADELEARRDELQRQQRGGTPGDELERAARALIAADASTAVVVDIAAELRATAGALEVNAKARDLLAHQLGLLELRAGQKRAAELHAEALTHITKIDRALAAVEAVQREAMAALARFEAEDDPLYRLREKHPGEKPTYVAAQLAPLRTWREDFLGDGTNPSKPERWRQECRELGIPLSR